MNINNETKIGILVVGVLIILGVLHWKAGGFEFKKEGYRLKVHFRDIDGVALNAPVMLNGFEVGRVEDIQFIYGEKTHVELTLWLEATARVQGGAKAVVKTLGFLGEKYIAITAGEEGRSFLVDGAVIKGNEPVDLAALLAEGQEVMANLKIITEDLKERLDVNGESIDHIIANTRKTMQNMVSITDNVHQRLEVNETLIDDFVVHMNSSSKNLDEMSADLKENPWKLLYKPKEKAGRKE
jgi:phospholipid/cholesterol/gamma-HCH transport system substrate-binding protein